MISIFVWCCLWQTKYFERMFHLWKRDRDVGVLSTWERLAEGAVLLSEWDFRDFFYYAFHCLEKKLEFNLSYLKLPLQYWRNYTLGERVLPSLNMTQICYFPRGLCDLFNKEATKTRPQDVLLTNWPSRQSTSKKTETTQQPCVIKN